MRLSSAPAIPNSFTPAPPQPAGVGWVKRNGEGLIGVVARTHQTVCNSIPNVWGVLISLLVVVLFLVFSPGTVQAADPVPGLDCLSCHGKQTLTFHDKLGSGNKACWVCHDSFDMKSLHLRDGTKITRADSSQVCGQCHQKRYSAWLEGTHGIPGTVAAVPCSACHNPHRPQVALLDITKPHPEPAPPPPPPPTDALMIVGITVVFMTGLAVVASRQGRKP